MVNAFDPLSDRQAIDIIWSWLGDIPDPEIPVISIVDLGIVRGVEWEGDQIEISLTPTYSGCPATSVIALSVEEMMLRRGVENFKVRQQLSPPWTTDWISEAGAQKLKDYGIAPPEHEASCAGMMKQGPVTCPRCASTKTSRISQFGSTPCKAAWRCEDCLEPFDYFKPF